MQKTINYEKMEDNKLIFLLSSIMQARKSTLKKKIIPNITKGEIPFLILLYIEGNKTQKQMAERFCFSESNAAKAIRKLEDKKLIIRQTDENNRRRKIVSLTEKGNKISEDIIAFEKEWEEYVMRNFKSEEIEILKRLLKEILNESIKLKDLK